MRQFWLLVISIGLTVFFAACGELDTVFSSQGTYRVNALVDDDHTLDENSIIDRNSNIRPRFENSVANDPDIRGLLVFVQNSRGTTVSRKIQYLISGDTGKAGDQQDSAPPATQTSAGESPGQESSRVGDPQGAAPEDPQGVQENPQDGTDLSAPPETPALAGELPTPLATPALAGEFPLQNSAGESPKEIPASSGNFSAETGDRNPSGAETLSEPDTPYFPAQIPQENSPGSASAEGLPPNTGTGQGAQDGGETPAIIAGKDEKYSALPEPVQTSGENGENIAASGTARGGNTSDTTVQAAGEKGDTTVSFSEAQAAGLSGTSGEASPGENAAAPDSADPGEAKLQDPPQKDSSTPPETEKQNFGDREYPDQILLVKTLDQLPSFQIFEEIEIGSYNLVFQVLGDQGILYKSFKPIYFLADADFSLGEIQSYLPVASAGNRLIPPGINVVLETEISADKRLDSYIIWQYGKKIIAQGRNSEGANYILWKTPEQPGFHNIRAEVFPLLPGDRLPANMLGKSKYLSLPVSMKTQGIKYFNETEGTFSAWYQLWGNLEDAKAPGDTAKQLQSLASHKPRWIPHNGIYGLFTGPKDVYTLPGKPFMVSAGESGQGRILLRLAPLETGTILTIAFAPESGLSGKAELNLSSGGGTLVLEISSYGVSADPQEGAPADAASLTARETSLPVADEPLRQSLALNLDEVGVYISVFVYFEIAPNRFSAKLSLEDPDTETPLISLPLASPLTGDNTVLFGARKKPESRGFDTNEDTSNGTAILNELALSFTQTPYEEDESDEGTDSPR